MKNKRYLDYREFFRSEHQRRKGKNRRYSLRSFARDLQMTPSRLCDVLRYRYGISPAAAKQIAVKLGLNERDSEYFYDLVESKHGRSRLSREGAKQRLLRKRAELKIEPLSIVNGSEESPDNEEIREPRSLV